MSEKCFELLQAMEIEKAALCESIDLHEVVFWLSEKGDLTRDEKANMYDRIRVITTVLHDRFVRECTNIGKAIAALYNVIVDKNTEVIGK